MRAVGTITFSFKDTRIKASEYSAAFGHGKKPVTVIKESLFIGKRMTMEHKSTGILIFYVGSLPKRTQGGLDLMQQTGLIHNVQKRVIRPGYQQKREQVSNG